LLKDVERAETAKGRGKQPSAFDYVPMAERVGGPNQEAVGELWRVAAPKDTRSVRERLAPDNPKALVSCAATIKEERRIKEAGIRNTALEVRKYAG